MTSDKMQQQFSQSLQSTAQDLWTRFQRNMPARYFKETTIETQLAHLHVLTACLATGIEQDLMVRSEGGDTYTFLTGKSYPGQLGQLLERLPEGRSLNAARAYTSKDGQWVLDIFELGDTRESVASEKLVEREFSRLSEQLEKVKLELFKEHLLGCASEYVKAVPARIAQTHFRLLEEAHRSGDVVVAWEESSEGLKTVRIVVEGTGAKTYFQRAARYLGSRGIDIERAYVTSFSKLGQPYRYLGFTVRGSSAHQEDSLTGELKRLQFVDDLVLDLWSKLDDWSLQECEVGEFLISLAHQLLCPIDHARYTRERLTAVVEKRSDIFRHYVEAYANRDIPGDERQGLDRTEEVTFFDTCQRIVTSVLEHNLAQKGRRALGAKFHPSLFSNPTAEQPFSVLFARGRDHLGFHVRFQKVARGGMRLVCPRSSEAHTAELERLFQEAYSLARAQHLKNKDIPEGGAKAAVLVSPGSDHSFCGKCFADTLLDLTVASSDQDLIYLGPDENVSSALIEWIAERAALRGHPLPASFMSSKPGAGINHKEFGITSEGVTVFLEESLRQNGLDPNTDPFTVKITGGPDGDVAGNEIRILLTRYPNTAKIVGIGDGSGVAEDPCGLDPEELLRLFESVAPISAFNPNLLSPQGRVVSVEQPGGVELRNSLHNRLKTDAFIPAGGRPATINQDNWQKFLDENGEPSSKIVVEGANLFLTESARSELSTRGASIIKDSSANKCGVVCSSFEVLASMLLTEEEFLSHKQEFVDQVIERLRALARAEVTLLFREHKRRPDLSLPELSVKLSEVMLRAAEAVAGRAVDPLQQGEDDGTRAVFESYLPPLLHKVAGRRFHKIPLDYRRRIVACSLAGKIVYREGITYLDDLPEEALSELALRYLRSEAIVQKLVEEVRSSGLASSDQLAALLEQGGARTLTHGSH